MNDAVPAGPKEFAALIDVLVGVEPGTFTGSQVSQLSGLDRDTTKLLWRAAGFPEISDDEPYFNAADVEVARGLAEIVEAGLAGRDLALRLARTMGQAASRLADAEVSALAEAVPDRPIGPAGVQPEAAADTIELARRSLPFLERALVHLWRRHLAAAARRAILDVGEAPARAVGFADIDSFAALSQRVDEDSLARVVGAFEAIAFDAVAAGGGRIVKLIGDAAMFTGLDPEAAARMGLEIVERCRDDEDVPDVSVGLAFGPVVDLQGDVFGPTVNRAARTTAFARAGSVVADSAVAREISAGDLSVQKIRMPVRLRGIGRVELYRIRRARHPEG